MMTFLTLLALVAIFTTLMRPAFVAATANRELGRQADMEIRRYPVGAAVHIYKDTNVGIDPAGYLKAFVPGDVFAGVAYEEIDNSSGTAGALYCRVRKEGDFVLPITSVAVLDAGKPVFCTDDQAYALIGHPDAFFGILLHYESSGYAVVRMRGEGVKPPNGAGSQELLVTGAESFQPTGATAGTLNGPGGFEIKSALGLGVLHNDAADGGVKFQFDAVAEVALASMRTINDTFPVAKGITLECDLCVADKGDAAALDIDFGFGTALTTDSEADVDHAAMVNLAAFHLDGASDNILAQSDDNSTDVAAADTTIDNDSTTDLPKRFKIIVRPSGAVEFWINGARVLSSTTFAVSAAANLAAFINMEKTSDDTTAVMIARNIRVAAGKAA